MQTNGNGDNIPVVTNTPDVNMVRFEPGAFSVVLVPQKQRNFSVLEMKPTDVNIGLVLSVGVELPSVNETLNPCRQGDYVYYRPFEGEALPIFKHEGQTAFLIPKVAVLGIYNPSVKEFLITGE